MATLIVAFCSTSIFPAYGAGDIAAGQQKAMSSGCVGCHGVDGNSTVPTFPKLAGQGQAYLLKQLQDYASGARKNEVMASFAMALSPKDMADISAFYAAQVSTVEPLNQDSFELGQQIYLAGNKSSAIPACSACHGPKGYGIPAAKWPSLSGQHAVYSQTQLNAFASGERNNDPNNMMGDIASRMSEEEKQAVSVYISSLKE